MLENRKTAKMDSRYTRQYAIRKVSELTKILKQSGINLHSVFLFGSFANKEITDFEWSDIDVALISDSFSGSRFDDAKRLIPFALKVEPRIELHPFTIHDFENSPFAKDEIEAKGIRIS